MSITATDFAPGQEITCTVTRLPSSEGQEKTLARLMRRDPTAARALRRSQMLRRRRMNTYIRGNRLYYSRERPARIVRVTVGESWTFRFTPDIAPDLASVSNCISISAS